MPSALWSGRITPPVCRTKCPCRRFGSLAGRGTSLPPEHAANARHAAKRPVVRRAAGPIPWPDRQEGRGLRRRAGNHGETERTAVAGWPRAGMHLASTPHVGSVNRRSRNSFKSHRRYETPLPDPGCVGLKDSDEIPSKFRSWSRRTSSIQSCESTTRMTPKYPRRSCRRHGRSASVSGRKTVVLHGRIHRCAQSDVLTKPQGRPHCANSQHHPAASREGADVTVGV